MTTFSSSVAIPCRPPRCCLSSRKSRAIVSRRPKYGRSSPSAISGDHGGRSGGGKRGGHHQGARPARARHCSCATAIRRLGLLRLSSGRVTERRRAGISCSIPNLDEPRQSKPSRKWPSTTCRTCVAAAPSGPFRLAGYCHGGLAAWEIAHQLEEAGREVEKIVMIDSISINARALDTRRGAGVVGHGPARRRAVRRCMTAACFRYGP